MRRWLYNLAAALSLVIGLTTGVLWLLSHTQYTAETITCASGTTWIEVANLDGRLYLLCLKGFEITDCGKSADYRFRIELECGEHGSFGSSTNTSPFWDIQMAESLHEPPGHNYYLLKRKCVCLGSRWVRGQMPPHTFSPLSLPPEDVWPKFDFIAVPHWLLILLSAAAPAWWLWHTLSRWQRSRCKLRCCSRCGYDLRAHNPGDRCPECGTAVPPSPVQSHGATRADAR